MGVEARIIGMWGAVLGIAGGVFGALTAERSIYGMIAGGGIGAAFGLFGGVMVAAEHWNAVRAIAKSNEVSEEALGSAHTRTVYVPLPYVSAFKLAEETLRVQVSSNVYRSDLDHGDLGAAIRIPHTRGYRITHVRMKVQMRDAERTSITVDCRAKHGWALLPDFGRNLDVAQRITRFLEVIGSTSNRLAENRKDA